MSRDYSQPNAYIYLDEYRIILHSQYLELKLTPPLFRELCLKAWPHVYDGVFSFFLPWKRMLEQGNSTCDKRLFNSQLKVINDLKQAVKWNENTYAALTLRSDLIHVAVDVFEFNSVSESFVYKQI